MRPERLIYIHRKEKINGPPLRKRSMIWACIIFMTGLFSQANLFSLFSCCSVLPSFLLHWGPRKRVSKPNKSSKLI